MSVKAGVLQPTCTFVFTGWREAILSVPHAEEPPKAASRSWHGLPETGATLAS